MGTVVSGAEDTVRSCLSQKISSIVHCLSVQAGAHCHQKEYPQHIGRGQTFSLYCYSIVL